MWKMDTRGSVFQTAFLYKMEKQSGLSSFTDQKELHAIKMVSNAITRFYKCQIAQLCRNPCQTLVNPNECWGGPTYANRFFPL